MALKQIQGRDKSNFQSIDQSIKDVHLYEVIKHFFSFVISTFINYVCIFFAWLSDEWQWRQFANKVSVSWNGFVFLEMDNNDTSVISKVDFICEYFYVNFHSVSLRSNQKDWISWTDVTFNKWLSTVLPLLFLSMPRFMMWRGVINVTNSFDDVCVYEMRREHVVSPRRFIFRTSRFCFLFDS